MLDKIYDTKDLLSVKTGREKKITYKILAIFEAPCTSLVVDIHKFEYM